MLYDITNSLFRTEYGWAVAGGLFCLRLLYNYSFSRL